MQTARGNDGYIEASVEETNRIRAELGLKPLEVKSDDTLTKGSSKRPVDAGTDTAAPVVKRTKIDDKDYDKIVIDDMSKLVETPLDLAAGEEMILTLKDSVIGDDDNEDILIETIFSSANRKQETEKDWYLKKDVVGIKDESLNEYAGVANQLTTMTNLGTFTTDDDYKRRQSMIADAADMVKKLKERKKMRAAGLPLPKTSAPSVVTENRDKDGAILTTEFSTVNEFCAQVELPQDKIAEITENRLLRERLARANHNANDDIVPTLNNNDDNAIDSDDESDEHGGDKKQKNTKANEFLAENDLGGGVIGVLDLLKSKGQIEKQEKKEKLRIGNSSDGYILPDVIIERKDDFGNALSLKEAFNRISYKFHGKGPGLNKQEKNLRKKVMERQERDGTALQKLPTLRALKSAQNKGSVYLNLSTTASKKKN